MRRLCNIAFAQMMGRCETEEQRESMLFELTAPLDPMEQAVFQEKAWARRDHPG